MGHIGTRKRLQDSRKRGSGICIYIQPREARRCKRGGEDTSILPAYRKALKAKGSINTAIKASKRSC
jgi:hypothetical protein